MTTIPATVQERIPLPAAGTPQTGGTGLSVGDIVGLLRGRMVMIILLWLLFSMVAVGAFFVTWIYFPTYRAEAWIECISNRPVEPETIGQPQIQKDEHTRFINSQARLIKSPQILLDVLKTAEVRGTNWFGSLEPDRRFTELDRELLSSPIRDTNYIRVSIGCRRPADPARIVQQVILRYLSFVRKQAKDEYRDELQAYKDEVENLDRQVTQKLQQIKEFTGNLPPGAQGGSRGLAYEQLTIFAEQVAALELQTMELEGLSQIYNDPTGPGISTEDRRMVEQDPLVGMLANRVFAIEQREQELLGKFGAEHREVKQITRQREVAQEQLDSLRDQKITEILEFRAEQVRTAFLNSQHALMLAREKLAESEAAQSDLDRKLAEMQTLDDELAFLKEARVRGMDFIREIERITNEQGQALQVSIAQSPVDPIERSSPRLWLLPMGIVAALLLAVGLALLVEFADTSVRTAQDVVRHLHAAVLGVVPDVDDEEVPIDRVETAVQDAPHSMVAEAFRSIRTNLQFSAPPDRQRTIIVTSPRPEDGKTAIACNLATCLAQGGRHVLLVDANFRRPALRSVYPNSSDKGLSNLLIDEGAVESLVTKTGLANLDVLHAGPTPPNPAERLASPQTEAFLQAALAQYDQIIIDAPPVLLATDACVLANKVDGAILVCRAKENSRGIAQRACGLLVRVNAHLFGVVLNAAQTRRGGYYREQISTFYEYQSTESLPAAAQPALPADETATTADGAADQDDA